MATMGDRRKRVIPPVPRSAIGTDRQPFDQALKENLDIVLGRVGEGSAELQPLSPLASTAEIVLTINALIERLR